MGLTRSTAGKGSLKHREGVLDDLLHWIWSWRTQVRRLLESTQAQGQGKSHIEKRQSFSLASYDEHITVVAGWNLARAMREAGTLFPSFQMAEDKSRALQLLRHLYEHWDEQRRTFQDPTAPKKRSAEKFTARFPHGKPWSITYASNDWLLGNIVGIRAITDGLAVIENEALKLEGELGKK